MSGWKNYRLSEFVEINPKVTLKSGTHYSFVEMKDLNESQKYVFPSQLKKIKGGARFQNSDTLFARITPCLQNGKICQVQGLKNSLGFGSTEFLVFRGKEGISNTDFVYYLSRYDVVRRFAEQNMVGTSGRQRVSKDVFANLELPLPDLSTQTAIAEILSSLDDKIELNNKINQELETLAQTLFKQWFIDFEFPNENGEPYKSSGGEMVDSELGEIPKSWDRIKLADLVTKSHTGADAITRAPIVDYDTGIKCARVGDMTNNRSFHNWAFCKISPEDYKRQKLEIGDIIVTRTATLGINQLIREKIEAVCNNGLIRLKINDTICDPMFVYVQLQANSFKEWINRISGDSSTRPNMQMDYLLDFSVIIPPKELMNSFVELAITFYDLIDKNNRSNEELIITRDTLLPKLISGELEINEISN
jgi:type I restriction enzyme S subunit